MSKNPASGMRWVVWSEEHQAWWRGGGGGYTASLLDAGRYSKAKALEIEGDANRYLRYGETREIAMPDPVPDLAFRIPGDREPRQCDRCGETYRGPAVYCCLACSLADA